MFNVLAKMMGFRAPNPIKKPPRIVVVDTMSMAEASREAVRGAIRRNSLHPDAVDDIAMDEVEGRR